MLASMSGFDSEVESDHKSESSSQASAESSTSDNGASIILPYSFQPAVPGTSRSLDHSELTDKEGSSDLPDSQGLLNKDW